ncbi:hypothetical protein G6F46_012141 [Rhizopus delemar]|uniref:Tc1-like transposase DDE domain-containing protein n=2 Tax=Rhizopus TaxID=4842 RepID=A0A9P7CIV5_9FUNG|nr:hypothetical protein G6F36_013667 [Rhizopus arrhizus]KAG1445681.1 hypothetical protein G6F55_011854 [Rhizopus delemar]KAG1488541.1 hypothetical protein G6F54_012022 [Rhizopus delemar]KAG1501325.1 hypothetical protein G6F53_011108 [Rhizopus delemar]KAG1507007.1 hypothetical protein G6F52_011744 [Rhizopus delemar]
MHPSGGWAEKGKPAIVTTPSTRAVYHTILGAISSKFAVSMELRNPKEEWSKHIKIDFHNCKRKAPSSNKKLLPRGADTGRYLVFLEKTMDEVDCLPERKGYYIDMDNGPIHTDREIDELITRRGYKHIYLRLGKGDL